MAEPTFPSPVKLFTGILFHHDTDLQTIREAFTEHYGSPDLETGPFPFKNTVYYSEIGTDLKKYFFSFDELIDRESIAEIKNFSNRLEKKMSKGSQRQVNIDPGYLTLSNVFLASCKDYYHRVYIGKGVFLENEYRYTDKNFRFWPWTYPDYQQKSYLDFFLQLRSLYHRQLKERK